MKKLLFLFIPLVFACSSDEDTPNMCVDETLISSDIPCLTVVEPVCGCDIRTYSNECYARKAGVTSYVDGECN